MKPRSLAAQIVARIRANVDAYWEDKIAEAAFHATQTECWSLAASDPRTEAAVLRTLRKNLPSVPKQISEAAK